MHKANARVQANNVNLRKVQFLSKFIENRFTWEMLHVALNKRES